MLLPPETLSTCPVQQDQHGLPAQDPVKIQRESAWLRGLREKVGEDSCSPLSHQVEDERQG